MSALTLERRQRIAKMIKGIIRRHIKKWEKRKISRRRWRESLVRKLTMKFNLRWQAYHHLLRLFGEGGVGEDDADRLITYMYLDHSTRRTGPCLPKRASRHVRKRLDHNPVQKVILE